MSYDLEGRYQWLNHMNPPVMLREMLKLYGLKEVKGKEHNPVIIGFAKEIGGEIASWYDTDEKPWCGLVMGIAAKRAGWPVPKGFAVLRALEWAKWGLPAQPMLSAVMVFEREGGGHVGLYIGEDDECYHILGGNQSNAVNITRIAKDRLVAARLPRWRYKKPDSVKKITLGKIGIVSRNEA